MKRIIGNVLVITLIVFVFAQFGAGAADINLARGAVVTASSFAEECGPENGVDGESGSDSARFQSGSRQWPQWYKIDLGDISNISGIQIYWARRVITYKYTLEVSDDDVNYILVRDLRYLDEPNTQGGPYERFNIKTSGRYLKITSYGCFNGPAPEGDFAFFEIAVTGSIVIVDRNPINQIEPALPPERPEPAPGEVRDLALGKTATASSFKEDMPPSEAVAIASSGGRFEANSRQFPQWYKVDFGEISNVESFEFFWMRRTLTYKYRLEISDDDENYTLIRDCRYITEANCGDSTSEKFDLITSGRYVRMTCYGVAFEGEPQGDFSILRFTANGIPLGTAVRNPVNAIAPSEPPAPVRIEGQPYNLAYKAKTSASMTNAEYPLENGVDEDMDSRWQAGNRQLPHWYKVDLGSICDISKFEIGWFKRGLTYRYAIEVSNDDVRWVTVRDEKTRTTPNLESGMTESVEMTTRGRYIKITCYACLFEGQPQGDFALAEFRVIGMESPDQDIDNMPGEGARIKAVDYEIKTVGGSGISVTINPAGDGFSNVPDRLAIVVTGRNNRGDISDIQLINMEANTNITTKQTTNVEFTPKSGLTYTAVIWDRAGQLY